MPSTASLKYSGPITVSATETIAAIATASGYTDSSPTAATYTITPPAASPMFSTASGTYTSAQSVTISDTTPGENIFYTTDGSTPSVMSLKYTSPISISMTETIRAIAIANGYTNSPIAVAAYTIAPPAAAPTFSTASATYTSAQSVTISDTTPGANIYYTTDGSIPSTSSLKYSAPISVSATETVQAIASGGGYSDSAIATASYTIELPATKPTFSPAAGTYTSIQTVALSGSTPDAMIFYTTDGSAPSTSSLRYTSPIQVNSSETINAIATAKGSSNSPVSTAAYVLNLPPAPSPTFSLPGGKFNSAQTLAISSNAPGASIYYTTDGTSPTQSSALYTGPLSVSYTQTVQAIAIALGYSNSAVTKGAFTIAATPVPVTLNLETVNSPNPLGNGISITWNDPKVLWAGGEQTCDPSTYPDQLGGCSRYVTNDGGATNAYIAVQDSTDAYIFIKGNGAVSYRIFVDDVVLNPLGINDPKYVTPPVDGNAYALHLVWSIRSSHQIRFESGEEIFGFGVDSQGRLVFPTKTLGPRFEVLGDSFVEPAYNFIGFTQLIGDSTGWEMFNSGNGGTGFYATNTNPGTLRGNYQSRVQADVCALLPNELIIYGSTNDFGHTATEEQSAASQLVATIKSCSPATDIILLGPICPLTSPCTDGTQLALGLKAEADADGLPFIDPIAESWISAADYRQDICTGTPGSNCPADNTHPTQTGHQAIADRLLTDLRNIRPGLF